MQDIKKLRIAAGLTQVELSKAIGLNQVDISRYECGSRKPNMRSAKKLGKFFGIPFYEFLDDSEE